MNHFVENPVLALFAGLIYFLCSLIVFIENRRGGFSYLLVYSEYFYFIGIGIGSIILALGIGSEHVIFENYLATNGKIGDLTFIHIISLSIGMVCGLYFGRFYCLEKFYWGRKLNATEYGVGGVSVYRWLIYSGLASLFIYMFLVGPVAAFTTAASARAGSFEGLENAAGFLFLKNIAQIGTVAIIFLPLIVSRRNCKYDISILIIYGLLLYALTGARAAIADTLVIALLIWFAVSRIGSVKKVFVAFVFGVFGLLFILYGKGLSDVLFADLFGRERFEGHSFDYSIGKIFDQFIHLVYSIDAGVKYFFANGPTITSALLLSPLGVFPSWLYVDFGLEFLSWQHVGANDNIVCLNSIPFDAEPCTMPPYYYGVSAYFAPVVGGLLFGFAKFYIYETISRLWRKCRYEPSRLWLPLLLFIVFSRLSTLIPNVIGLFSFFAVVFISIGFVRWCLIHASISNNRL